ncbi:MAG TPA: PDZ domain-containing protein [Chitinophagaceae bacterium]|nr:PDZ domain-containing protein [Chitinophagaceae bacterium]
MKRIIQLSAWALAAACISTGALAQQNPTKTKPKEPTKTTTAKEKDKMDDYDEIIIKRKGEKGGKVTVEIKGDDVLVNGKPISEYDNDDISVRKRDVTVWDGNARAMVAGSPFRYRSGEAYTMSTNRAFLGVSTEKDEKGARITNVTENSAAEKAGLKEDDVIIRVDDTKIENHDQLSKAIVKHKPEDKVTIAYLRGGKEQKATVALGRTSFNTITMPKGTPAPEFNFDFDHNGTNQSYYFSGRGRIGIRAQDTEEGKGVKVLDVGDESLAEKAGLKEGDIITEFDGKAINSADELADAAKASKEKSSISVKYTRDGKANSAEIKIPKKLKTTNL